jgi:hypothetical protein
VLGVDDPQAAWPTADQAAQVVQGPVAPAVAEAGAATARARPAAVVARAPREEWWREVFDTGDAFRTFGDIFTGSHGWFLQQAEQNTTVESRGWRRSRTTQFLCYILEKTVATVPSGG